MPTPERLARLIADLDHEAFATRQSAMKDLGNLGDLVEPTLRRELSRPQSSLEVRRRLERLLAELTDLTSEQLRWLRTIQTLQLVGSAEATRLLDTLARDAPNRPRAQRRESSPGKNRDAGARRTLIPNWR